MDAVIQNVASEVTILAKIIGIGAIDVHYFCVMCNAKFSAPTDSDEFRCPKDSCKYLMLLNNCKTTCSVKLIVADVENNLRSTLFFNMDQVMKLKNIILPLEENEMAKLILRFPDILEIKFDFVSKAVLNVLKV